MIVWIAGSSPAMIVDTQIDFFHMFAGGNPVISTVTSREFNDIAKCLVIGAKRRASRSGATHKGLNL